MNDFSLKWKRFEKQAKEAREQAENKREVTFKDFPIKSPCETCGIERWRDCYHVKKACQKLWDYLAFRGDWVMEQNAKLRESHE